MKVRSRAANATRERPWVYDVTSPSHHFTQMSRPLPQWSAALSSQSG